MSRPGANELDTCPHVVLTSAGRPSCPRPITQDRSHQRVRVAQIDIMSNKKSITPAQCRGARAMLAWSQEQLATAANLTRQTIANFESETRTPGPNNVLAIKVALEGGGVVFIDPNGGGPGVRLKEG